MGLGLQAIVTPFELDRNWSRQFDPEFNRKYVHPPFATRKPVIIWRGSLKWEESGSATGRRGRAIAMSDAVRALAVRQVFLASA